MGQIWSELRAAIARLNFLITDNRELHRQVYALQQQLRDLRSR